MATIRTAIQLYDNFSPALRSMQRAMTSVISSFEALDAVSSNAVDTSAIRQARDELARAEVALDGIEENIRQADEQQRKFNQSVRNCGSEADILKSKFMGVAGVLGVAFSGKKILELADTMTQTTARLNLMNDGLQTTEELQNKIMDSANRSRAAYQTTADAVAKMGIMAGDAFKSNDEIIAFTEQINKQFTIAGTSAAGIDAAMLQLTQAMASGVLRGEELNSIFEQAPTIIQSIADYLDVPIGNIRAMAQEGLITADVVKNAMFATADETNRKFESMPYTFSQVWTQLQNVLLQAFNPLIQIIGSGAQWIADNWSTLEPIFWGVGAAVGVVAAAFAIWKMVTLAQTIAQWALNSALLASPITWIVLAIAAVVGAIVIWINKIGGVKVAWLTVCNAILTAWDWVKIGFFTGVYWVIGLWEQMQLAFKTVATNIANFMGDMKANVLMILQNMVNGAIRIINDFISILNKLPGVSIDAIAEVTFGTTAQLENNAAKNARNNELANYRSELEANAKAREASLNQMKADARAATAERQAEIDAAKVGSNDSSSLDAFNFGSTLDGIYGNRFDLN
ncbi:MAG: tape measure protein [Eubacteriales bacterium]|jgi:tape measure domain-containing protein